MNNDLELILNYLNENRGFDFSGYHPAMIERRLKQRLSASGCHIYDEYLNYIQENQDELDRLVDVLTINVSRFFRNTLTFAYIADKILPAIGLKKMESSDHSLRIWSAGCSTGEEPYSIAILINELTGKEGFSLNVNIFATDIDKNALVKAQEATYEFESIKNLKYGLLKKYFTAQDDLFRLIPEIKETVNFTLYDILDKKSYSPPESVYGDFDMVLCRNVLIYFQPRYQDTIFERLHRALAENGYLVLGEAEIPLMKYKNFFREVNPCCHIYQKI